MNYIDILEQLVITVEQAGANLAPTYQEYMPLAFAVGNSCSEQGRSLFHRICRLSEKYQQADADKLYDHALQNGRGGNSLGTVFHLAELAGVRLDKKLANLHNLPDDSTPTRTYTRGDITKDDITSRADITKDEAPLPCFPVYPWPGFLQQVIDCGESPAQRDILLLGALTVFGATLNKLTSIVYSRKLNHPCLQTFIIAPPASGKGVLAWVRHLAEPIHDSLMKTYYEKMKTYRQEVGAHCRPFNRCSIGICYEGGLDENGHPADTRTPEQTEQLEQLVWKLRKLFPKAELRGHRDMPGSVPKACPCFDCQSAFPSIR